MASPPDILEILAARQALATTPSPWLDAARGSISIEEAADRVAQHDAPALVERSKRLFAPDPEADERRLQELLEAFGTPRRSWTGPLVVLLALAAGLMLALTLLAGGRPSSDSPELAQYSLELHHTARTDRADRSDEPPAYFVDRRFSATLRPWEAVDDDLEVAAYVCTARGTARALPMTTRFAAHGLIELEASIRDLDLGVGSHELVLVIGRAGSMPALHSCLDLDSRDDGDAQLIRTRVEILPRPQ